MLTVGVTLVSILLLAGLAWLAGRRLRSPVCPVCFGVAGTWLWMIAARSFGLAIDPVMLAVLLGASVVGFADRLEARVTRGRSPLLWKSFVLPIGFAAAYGVVAERWVLAAAASLAFALAAVVYQLPRRLAGTHEAAVEKLEQQMKKCC